MQNATTLLTRIEQGYSNPEDIFLKNNPTIAPAHMCSTIISRSQAIVSVAVSGADEGMNGGFSADVLIQLLMQLDCNLKQLERVTDLWKEAECKLGSDQDPPRIALHLETNGLVD